MAEVSNEFLAEMLRRMQADLTDIKLDVREICTGLGRIEMQIASLSSRMDRRNEPIERVMRRLDRTDAH